MANLHRLFFKLLKYIYTEQHVLIDYFEDCYDKVMERFSSEWQIIMKETEDMFASEITKTLVGYSKYRLARIGEGNPQ